MDIVKILSLIIAMIGTGKKKPISVCPIIKYRTNIYLTLWILATTLFNDITQAKELFIKKCEAFKGLTELYRDCVTEWNRADRKARLVTIDKEVECVYRQSQKKGNAPHIL